LDTLRFFEGVLIGFSGAAIEGAVGEFMDAATPEGSDC
jgi:hypothetical protein